MSIDCKLNQVYKDALKKSKKLIKKVKTVREIPLWGGGTQRISQWKFQIGSIRLWENYIPNHRTLSCCGIDEEIFGHLHGIPNIWKHKEFTAIVAAFLNGRRRKDKRVFITGLPVKVKSTSSYNAKFYTKLRKVLLSFGCQELTKTPYKNQNSRNYISVLVGQHP